MENETATTEQVDELEQFEADFSETDADPQLEEEADGANQEVDEEGSESEPTEPVEATVETEEEPEEEPKAHLYPVPDNEKFGELRGQKLSAAQLEEAGLLEKFMIWEHQELGAQKGYQELKEKHKALESKLEELTAPQQQPEPTAEPKQELSPEEIKGFVADLEHRYVPTFERAAENGGVERDFVDLYPKYMAVNEHRLQSGQAQITLLFDIVKELAEDYSGRTERETTTSEKDHLIGIMDEVSKNEGYEVLADDGVRQSFIEFFATDKNGRGYEKMPTRMVNAAIMEDAILAFLRMNPGVIPTEEAPSPRAKSPSKRRLATGGGGGGGGGSSAPSGELSDFENEFLETRPQ